MARGMFFRGLSITRSRYDIPPQKEIQRPVLLPANLSFTLVKRTENCFPSARAIHTGNSEAMEKAVYDSQKKAFNKTGIRKKSASRNCVCPKRDGGF